MNQNMSNKPNLSKHPMNNLFLTMSNEMSFAQSPLNSNPSKMFSHVILFSVLCCMMLSNYHGLEYAALCRNNVLSLLVPYKCLCLTLKVS